MINTGLRNSELCNLKLEDVDLERNRIKVNLDKGNKNRIVGIAKNLKQELINYLKIRGDFENDYFFLERGGVKLNNNPLRRKVSRIAKRSNLDFSPHSLRRSFVTINAAKGRPLNHLRIACGHSDISTTQGYCMTTEEEVVDAMYSW